MEHTIIAHIPILFPHFNYQIITSYENERIWLKAVNILLEDKIIEKIKFKNKKINYSQDTAEKIAIDFFKEKLLKPRKTNKKQKINKAAKTKAASDLMKDLHL